MNSNFLNKIKHLFLPVVFISILFLIIPSSTCAIIPVIDVGSKALDGIEEFVGPIAAFLTNVFFIYVKSLTFLWVSTEIFDRVIWLNLEHVAVDTPMVLHGWEFVSGIANMALILIFIALAFSLILKIGSIDVKKALPKLIIVALLLNFSLVFIGMAIDITNVFYRTFLPPIGEDLMEEIMGPFLRDARTAALAQATAIISSALAFAKPIVNIAAQIFFVVVVPTVLLPFIVIAVFQIFVFIILSAMFFLYIFIFGARIFVIQILAILSPLAFLCLIMPQTKKYWDMWLKWLLEWLFVGIFLLFFLRLGFLIFGVFREDIGLGIPWLWALGEFFLFYLFVIIYLGVLAFMAKKFMPEFAQAAITQAMGFAKWATMGWAVTGKTAFKHGIAGSKTSQVGHRVKGWGERLQKHGKARDEKIHKKGWHKLERGMGSLLTIGGRKMAVDAEQTTKKEEEELKKEYEQQTTEERISAIQTATTHTRKSAALQAAIGKGESKQALDAIQPGGIEAIYNKEKAMGTGNEKNIASAYPQRYKNFGMDEEEMEKLIGRIAAKPELIRNMHTDVYNIEKSPSEVIDQIALKFGGRQISEAARSGDIKDLLSIFEKRINKSTGGFEKLIKENASAASLLANPTARGTLGIPDIIHLPQKQVDEMLRRESSASIRRSDIPNDEHTGYDTKHSSGLWVKK